MNDLVSFTHHSSHYREMDYRTDLMGTSDCNKFVPFYSLFAHNMLVFEDIPDLRVLEYNIPASTSRWGVSRQYANMFQHLKNATVPRIYSFRLAGIDHSINMHRGILYKDNTIYVCLGIDTEYVLNTPISQIQENPDNTKFSLFINNEFESVGILKNIRKKVNNEYVSKFKENNVDIIYTSRIENWLFNNNFHEPSFSTVTGLMQHLQEEVPRTLLM